MSDRHLRVVPSPESVGDSRMIDTDRVRDALVEVLQEEPYDYQVWQIVEPLISAVNAARPVLEYVSMGRKAVAIPALGAYPDVMARQALGRICEIEDRWGTGDPRLLINNPDLVLREEGL